jgi:hypothetical protein
MKKLPIGISTFSEIITGGYCYADKTGFVHRLAEQGKYFFLSRPRRFGKSLFLDTLKEAFSGNRELFAGLELEGGWDWERPYPVVSISFAGGVVQSREQLQANIRELLNEQADLYGIVLKNETLNGRFRELLAALQRQSERRVVVLVDEYDKPILDNITDRKTAAEVRSVLRDLYSVIKESDKLLRFCLLAGVSKFSKVSLFSGLNNLQDLSLDRRYATLCGYTEQDVSRLFADRMAGVDREELRRWYNGYNFLGERVYNPFDLLLFFDTKEYGSYWFETGTPRFLVDLLAEGRYSLPGLERLLSTETLLSSFDIDYIHLETLLYQTGYVTVQSERRMGGSRMFELSFPNLEVKMGFCEHVLQYLVHDAPSKERNKIALFEALEAANMENIRAVMYAFFASIPSDWYRRNQLARYEGFYSSVVYAYFAALGLEVKAEDASSHGRMDLSVRIGDFVYVFEFKVTELEPGGAGALSQIRDRGYHEKYMEPGKTCFLVGVEFSSRDRNIVLFEWERVAGCRGDL